ncbi:MAG: alpha-N-acetylglucosaminidase TIM-barrel domain-containing protein [Phocaeicola vulgatus]
MLLPGRSQVYSRLPAFFTKKPKSCMERSDYYSIDPFHEAKSLPAGLDFGKAGKAIMDAMKKANPKAVWVVQGWTENPRPEMMKALNPGDLLILDLFSECRPMWGIPSIWKRDKGYEEHNWLFCLLENFGGNVGLHGRMDQLLHNFYLTKDNPLAAQLKGIGLTMEGIENNPVMFELMCELPWRAESLSKEEWIKQYIRARYGTDDESIWQAWQIPRKRYLQPSAGNNQQGPQRKYLLRAPITE